MSTPMFDLPSHLRMGLTVNGHGPADPPDPAFDHWGCWCGDPACTLWKDDPLDSCGGGACGE